VVTAVEPRIDPETFMTTVAILGTGLIGSSIGLRLHQSSAIPELEVVGFDRYRRSLQAAKQVGAVDRTVDDPERAVRGAALVILSAPILSNHWLMEQIAHALEPGAVVTDTGSTKAETMRQARRHLPTTVAFVGGHPMAGKTETGAKAADAALFEGARWVVVPPANAPERAVDTVVEVAETCGAEAMFMDAEEHDAYVAAISHLPMLSAIGLFRLARASEAWPELSLLAAGGFKDATRLASTDPAMSYDIMVTNREQIAHWLDRMRDELRELREAVMKPDGEEDLFKLIAQTEFEYAAYRGGKVGREVKDHTSDAPTFDFSSFIMGEAIKQKMHEISRSQEERLKEQDEARRLRRDV
jgi:prephenate dehydrogenase